MGALEQCSKAELIAIIRQMDRRIAELSAQVAALQAENAKLHKNSSTSSKPPSSDVVKPPKSKPKGRKKKRKIGGQPGHPKQDRPAFTEKEVNGTWEYHLKACPDCGGNLKRAKDKSRVVQQVELVKSPIRIDAHRGLAYYTLPNKFSCELKESWNKLAPKRLKTITETNGLTHKF